MHGTLAERVPKLVRDGALGPPRQRLVLLRLFQRSKSFNSLVRVEDVSNTTQRGNHSLFNEIGTIPNDRPVALGQDLLAGIVWRESEIGPQVLDGDLFPRTIAAIEEPNQNTASEVTGDVQYYSRCYQLFIQGNGEDIPTFTLIDLPAVKSRASFEL